MGKKNKSRAHDKKRNEKAEKAPPPATGTASSSVGHPDLSILIAVIAVAAALTGATFLGSPSKSEDKRPQSTVGCHPKRQHLCSPKVLEIADRAYRHFSEGQILAGRGLIGEAIARFNASLRIDNSTAFASAAASNLAVLLSRQGDDHSALAMAERAAKLDPESFYAHNGLANQLKVADRPGDWAAAAEHYAVAVELAKDEPSPPGQNLPIIALTNYGNLLRLVAHREGPGGRREAVLNSAANAYAEAVETAREGDAPPTEARDAVIGLQDVLRRLDRVDQRERLIEWAVLEGIWRDRRQHPRSLNRALYDAMPKPINPWIENPEERMPILRRAREALRPILSEYRAAARSRGLGPVGRRVERDRELYDGAAGHVWEEVPIISGNKFLNPRLAPTVTEIFGGMISPSGQAAYSVVAPGTRIDPHCGPTNEMVTCHLGLMVPDVPTKELGISAGGEVRGWKEGGWICFEDSFEHFVWNDSREPRVVLLVNLKHPFMVSETIDAS